MRELSTSIPDPTLIPELQPEELGAKILFILRSRKGSGGNQDSFHLNNERLGMWPQQAYHSQLPSQPWAGTSQEVRAAVDLSVTEAWAWLRAQGLLIPAPNGGDWEVLSRRARNFETEAAFASYVTARLLPKEILHPLLSQRVWLAFMRGDFDAAVFFAMKAVEVRVREASGFGDALVGTALMRKAFDVENGPLTDLSAERSEREARSALFAGAIGSYKNPQSHREVNLEEPARALEIVLLANHLLGIVDIRETEKT